MTCKPSESIKTHARTQRKHEKQISTIKYATKTENITSKNYVKCIFFLHIHYNASIFEQLQKCLVLIVQPCAVLHLSSTLFHRWSELIWAGLSSAELIWADRPRSTFRDFGDNILKTTSNVQSSTRNRPKNFPFTPDLLHCRRSALKGKNLCYVVSCFTYRLFALIELTWRK